MLKNTEPFREKQKLHSKSKRSYGGREPISTSSSNAFNCKTVKSSTKCNSFSESFLRKTVKSTTKCNSFSESFLVQSQAKTFEIEI